MKKILLLFALIPTLASAQKWEIGISAGSSLITQPNKMLESFKACPSLAFGATINRIIKPSLNVGLDVNVASLVVKDKIDYVDINGNPTGTQVIKYFVGAPAIIITPSLSYRIGGLYMGPQLGVVVTSGGTNQNPAPPSESKLYYKGSVGYCGGAHLGYRHSIAKNISLGAEIRGNYMHISADNSDLNFVQAQATIGATYDL